MKKWILLLMILVISFVCVQNNNDYKIKNTIHMGSSNSDSYILNIIANKIVLTEKDAVEIAEDVFDEYKQKRCNDLTIYLYANKWYYKKETAKYVVVYKSDYFLDNTLENLEKFHMNIKKL